MAGSYANQGGFQDLDAETRVIQLVGQAVERVTTSDPNHVSHWTAICRELLALHQRILDHHSRGGHAAATATSCAPVDVVALRTDQDRLQGRLEYWYRRQWELTGLHLDSDRHCVDHRGTVIKLTKREFQLLAYLMRTGGRPCTPQEIICRAWHNPDLSPDEVRIYVRRLRTRLREIDLGASLRNHPGQGYSWTPQPALQPPSEHEHATKRNSNVFSRAAAEEAAYT